MQRLTMRQTQSLLNYIPIQGGYQVYYENGVYLGDILTDVDGFYYYWPELRGGSWASIVMRLIADKLDELNQPWEEEIERYFNETHKVLE